jgi:nucleoside-diphosphate kinase
MFLYNVATVTDHRRRFPTQEILTVERTLVLIKPDGVQRGLVGEILGRFEQKGFKLVGLKLVQTSRELAEQHYAVHRERAFFGSLVEFITSSPLVAFVLEGEGVVAAVRLMVGATNPLTAAPGTIRGDFGVSIGRNIIHASDAIETAQSEIALWFGEYLVDWTPTVTPWVYE